jgi:Alpha/beta hydrolase family
MTEPTEGPLAATPEAPLPAAPPPASEAPPPTPEAPLHAPPAEGGAPAPRSRRRWRRIVLAIAAVLAVALVAMLAVGTWYVQPQPLLPEATAALASTSEVTFADEPGWLSFTPTSAASRTGLIVYPGAKVEPAGYAPTAQAIAGAGYPVFIAKMPLNLAVLGLDAATPIIDGHPEIERWAIAGHSLGGAMATNYISSHPGSIQGLALWASYPNADLSALPLDATSIWGSLDAGAARMGGPEARADLPPDAVFIEIPGGNHEQMGWYTGQPNDPPATISREAQQAAVVDATVAMLARVDEGG